MQIINSDVLKHIKTLPDCSQNLTFADPPYFMGTEFKVVNGKLAIKGKPKDFMGKWNIGGLEFWEAYFSELYRVMKYGGYVCFYSISQQDYIFKYLMLQAGFKPTQTLFWANIQNFPKAIDASKEIDKRLKLERKVAYGKFSETGEVSITAPASDLAKLFDGYKYGIAPFKKITEPLLVFVKPPKRKSVLNDLMSFENDSEISPCVIDVNGNRVGIREKEQFCGAKTGKERTFNLPSYKKSQIPLPEGRFPCTLFVSESGKEMIDSWLDKYTFELNGKFYADVPKRNYLEITMKAIQNNQVHTLKVWKVEREELEGTNQKFKVHTGKNVGKDSKIKFISLKQGDTSPNYNDSGYLSRIMQSADFDKDDYDSFENSQSTYAMDLIDYDTVYHATVNPAERNEGLEPTKKTNKRSVGQAFNSEGSVFDDTNDESNNHPTLKPIALNRHFASLFKLPEGIEQNVYVPFLGSGSEVIGLLQAGFNPNHIIGVEINPDFIEIAKKRIAYFANKTNVEIANEAIKPLENKELSLF